jgi:tetratricopeptide (TPR) repeat protein
VINAPKTPLQRYRAQAQELLVRKRYDLAEPVIRKILAIVPQDPNANRQLASSLMSLRRLDEALDQARRAVAVKPDSELPHVILAAVFAMRSENELAIPCYLEALRLKADFAIAYFGLADCCAQLDRWPEALEWAAKGLSLNPTHCGMLRVRAMALAAVGRAEESMQVVQEFFRLEPNSAASHGAAGSALRFMGRHDGAAAHLLDALAITPTSPQTHKVLALVRLQQDRLDDARHHFNQALALHPGLPAALQGLKKVEIRPLWQNGTSLMKERRFEEAENAFLQILAIDSGHPVARSELARAVLLQHRHDEALQLANEAVRLRPRYGFARYVLACVLGEFERYDESFEQVDEALRLQPDRARFYSLRPLIHIDLDQYAEALAAVDQGLAVQADQVTLLRIRAICWAGLGCQEDAIQAVATFEDDFYAHLYAAHVYRLLKQYGQSEAYYRRALEIDQRSLTAQFGLGLVYFEQGRFAEAKPLLQESLRLNPHARRARNALSEITSAPAT